MRFLATLFVLVFEVQGYALPIVKNTENFVPTERLFRDFTTSYNFEGIVSLSNCSGSLVRLETAKDTDKALVLSNGHCVSADTPSGFIRPGEYIYNKAAVRSFGILNPEGTRSLGTVRSTKVLYATMTGTDMSLYELDVSYEQIQQRYNTRALVLESQHPVKDDSINVLSGYWRRGYTCKIEDFVHRLKEDAYTWTDSLRYTREGCHTIHGTSGSPVVSVTTGKVVGVNNTGNDDGQRCTMDNPCEESEDGTVYYEKGRSYAQQTHVIYSCLNADGVLDLATEGCQLQH